ncbi:hypothetical protein SDC9_191004 [bioreactor metagenome]|uniref:Uncharacterized protein n=1 Tax=bioreactor metagenome TaxID=1076179 RepID=A0A645I4V2_9ZZZZ
MDIDDYLVPHSGKVSVPLFFGKDLQNDIDLTAKVDLVLLLYFSHLVANQSTKNQHLVLPRDDAHLQNSLLQMFHSSDQTLLALQVKRLTSFV